MTAISTTAPLMAGQQRMWLLSQLDDAAALNLVLAVRLRGPLNPVAVRQALDDTVSRHEVLRTVIEVCDGEPRQVVHPPSRPALRIVDLSGLPGSLVTTRLQASLRAETRRPLDLSRGPLLRAMLVRVGRHEHALAVALHHAITDGWSVGLLAAELSALYRSYLDAEPAPLREVPRLQCADVARWQQSHPVEPGAGLLARIERLRAARGHAPLTDGGPARNSGSAAVWTCALPPRLTQRLADLRRAEGGSLFMLVVAALMTLAHRLDGRRDVVIGTLAAGRTRPEWEPLLGYFVNVLPLVATVEGGTPFRALWRAVREDCVAAYAAQDLPYEKLLELLHADGPARSANPISVLCVQQQPVPPLQLPGLECESIDLPHPYAQFDLTVEIREQQGSVHLAFQYDTGALDAGTVEQLGRHLRTVLAEVCADPDVPCGRVPLAAGVDCEAPSVEASTGAAATPEGATLPALFDRQAALTPDAVALTHGARALTYGALNAGANRMARHLRCLGVAVEDRVAILLHRSFASTLAALAVTKAGAAYVPLDASYPPDRLAAILADAAVACVVTTAELAGRLPDGIPRVLVDEDRKVIGDRSGRNPGLRLSDMHAAHVIYTSGTTGAPRGVVGTHRNTVGRLRWMWSAFPFAPGERSCQRTSLGFVDSVWEMFGPLLQGVPSEVIDQDVVLDPVGLADALARAQVTRLVVVPAMLGALLDAVPDLHARLPYLTLCVSSGERLPTVLAARYHAAMPGRALLNLYGSTEVSADVTAALVPAGCRVVTIGRPIAGAGAVVLDARGRPSPVLATGELFVDGPAVTRGYHGRPAETAARYVPDAAVSPGARSFRTGDRARLRADGDLELLGRADDQLQLRGFRVEPAEVEAVLLGHPGVAEAAVTAWPDAAGTAMLIAYVVPRSACTATELLQLARRGLPPHCVPSAVVLLEALPHTSSGKVDRKGLPPPAPASLDRTDVIGPATPSETLVGEVFTELLPVPWRSVHDDFFMLGGHSILAAALVQRLRRLSGVDLSLRGLFSGPTIADLARQIDDGPPNAKGSPRPLVARSEEWCEPFPLTEVQQAYWVGRSGDLELGNVSTHAYFELDVERLDVAGLERAVGRLVERHAALRTVIRADGQQQVLADPPPQRLPLVDLRAVSTVEAESRLGEVRDEMSHQVLPADRWPLFDLRVSLLSGNRARLHVSIDALIADAYSVQLLMQELASLYHRPQLALEPLSLTFRDCVLHELAQRDTPAHDKATAYWMDRIDELPAGPELPLAGRPGSIARPRFTRWSTVVAADRWSRFCAYASAAGVTPSAALLGAFTEVLSAWSRRPHYSLILTLFNRLVDHPQVHRLVGDFTSLTLLEVEHGAGGSFANRARRLQERIWADLDHREVSAVTVMREWHLRRGGRPGLLAPVVFTSNLGVDATAPDRTGADEPDRMGELVFGITQTPQVYLDHQVTLGPDGLLLAGTPCRASSPTVWSTTCSAPMSGSWRTWRTGGDAGTGRSVSCCRTSSVGGGQRPMPRRRHDRRGRSTPWPSRPPPATRAPSPSSTPAAG